MAPRYALIVQTAALMALFLLPTLLKGQGCNITDVVVSNEQCNPGFAPVGFQINVSGTGTSTTFLVSSSDGLIDDPGPYDYAFGAFINLTPSDPNQPIYSFTVTDANNPSCTFTFTIFNPCNSTPCNLSVTGGSITCDNGGTPNDPSDDTFFQNVFVENDGATGSWSSNGPDNASGNYGDLVFLGPYPASGGDVTFTITDDNDPSCSTVYTVENVCDDICNITDALVSGPNCNDNGTPNDTSDDFIFFSLAPQGQGLANGSYTVTTSLGSPAQNTGAYGGFTQFSITPDPGSPSTFTITITDLDDPSCTFTLTLTNPCFTNCAIIDAGFAGLACSNGDFSFSLSPSGDGLGGSYTVTSPSGTISPGIAFYGGPTTFGFTTSGPPPANDEYTIIITDGNDPNCTFELTFLSPCTCGLTNGLVNSLISCDDQGTSDPNDDVFIIELQPEGTNLSGSYTLVPSVGTLTPAGPQPYGVFTTFELSISSTNGQPTTLTIVDSNDPSCTVEVITTTTAPCSPPACDITDPGVISVTCDDFNSPTSPGDDFAVVELNPIGTGLSGTYIVTSPEVSASPGIGTYGTLSTQQLFDAAQAGDEITLILTDSDDPSCSITFTIPNPAPCATTVNCDLTNPGLGFTLCNDNGTPSDPSDDFYTFPLNPVGTGLGGGYTVSVGGGTVSPPGGNYGSETTFTLTNIAPPAGISVIVTDNDDPNCTTNTIINLPPPCSTTPPCELTQSTVVTNQCVNGSPVFELLVDGVGLGANYTINVNNAVIPGNNAGNYGQITSFTIVPTGPNVTEFIVTITDADDPTCTATTVVSNPCPSCTINPVLNNITCNDNGTPGNPNDDVFFASVTVNGTGSPSGWAVSPVFGPATGAYGSTIDFGPIPISGGLATLTFTDQSDPTCSESLTLTPPAPCSVEPCNLGLPTVITPICDNGAIDFELLVDGTGTGINYQVSTPEGVLTAGTTGNYGQVTLFTFLPNSLSADNFTLTVTDSDDPTCTQTFSLDNPCDACLITSAAVSNVQCADNGTPGDPTDDLITFSILADGVSTAGSYTISAPGQAVQPSTGTFGSLSSFALLPGSAGSGLITLTLTDASDSNCTTTVQLSDPGTCSDACAINAFVTETNCIPTGVPEDDFFQATIQAINPVGTAGWTAQTPLGPVTGNYNQSVDIGPFLISQGSFSLTITDQFNPGCSTNLLIVPPDPCSVVCEADTTLFDLQSCNPLDTGTVIQNLTGQEGCDSIVITSTSLLPSDSIFLVETSCSPADTGAVEQNFTNQFGCDSIVVTNTVLVDSDTTLIDLQSCNPADTGTVVQNLTGQTGCDSIIITSTTLLPSDSTLLTQSSCNPADTGTVSQILTNQFGCDSVVVTNTLLVDSDTTLIDLQSCNPSDTGTVVQNLTGQTGCDSIVITATTLLPSDSIFLVESSCNPADTGTATQVLVNQFGCDSVVVTNILLVDSDTTLIDLQSCNPVDTGTVVQNLTGQTGCDSIVITATTLLPSDSIFLVESSCNPADTGSTTQVLVNQFGCDSVVVTNILLVDSDTTLIDLQSCNPVDTGTVVQNFTGQTGCDSIVITATTLLPSDTIFLAETSCSPVDTGTVTQVLVNQFGCDSTIITTTTLLPSDTTLLFSESCNPQDTGTVSQVLTNQFGCDSTIITTTSLLPSDTTLLFSESCNPQDTGTVSQLLTNQFGCDSTIITTTTLLPSDTTLLFSESCNPQDTGTVSQLLTNQFGCDSTIITTTTLLPSDTILLFSESCNPADTGTVSQVLANQFGCDSTIITTTTLLPSDTTLLTETSCNPLDTGTVTQVLANQFGCDSTVITTTTLLPSDTTLLTETSCNPLDTGTVTQILANQFGCDSTVITTTTLLPSDTTLLTETSCNPLDTGTVTQVLANQFGCDSTVITTTTLLPSDTTLLAETSCNPLDTGTVTQVLANQFGCDSTVITTTTLLPSDTTLLFNESCNPADTGTLVLNLDNQFGCDSTVITTTTLLPSDTTLLFSESCNPADTGTTTQILTSSLGCDSVVITQIQLQNDPDFELITDTLCAGEFLTINGTVYDEERPIGQEIIQSVTNGCDSVIIDIAIGFSDLETSISATPPPCAGLTGAVQIGIPENGFSPYRIFVDGLPIESSSPLPVSLEVAPGMYTITVEDQLGCSEARQVTVPEGLVPELTLDSPINAQAGDTIVLAPILNFDPDQLLWTPAGQLSCTDCLNPTLTAFESGTYQLIAGIGGGCEARATVQVIVDQRSKVYAPNIFSPNEDGRNDRFTLFGDPTEIDLIEQLGIYDRWGNQVFLKTAFPVNVEAEGWDGTFRGQSLDPAVFTYYARLRLINGRQLIQQGDVTLIR
ncbi:MAG: gliding motility-associated C-terminal domain-containing protein [Phaeodactylibacter sp.]|uniref:T9SS type B sorting domain-containing protein n=1 Tax=Phaeodactylibacter sp. TaxID=1940289 RepID=UPI0032EEDAFF